MREQQKLSIFLGAFFAIGALLMIATGLIVYYCFCLDKEVIVEEPKPIEPPIANLTILSCNCPDRCVKKPHIPCPKEDAKDCPLHPLMPATRNPHACAQPCRSCTRRYVCENSPLVYEDECSKQYQSMWEPKYPELKTEEELMSKTVLQWVTTYPANSPERLSILTQLMDFGIEPYVRAMSRRNCKDGLQFKLCTFCQDRYEYLRCAMQMRVKITNKHGYKNTNKLTKITEEFKKNYANNAYWYSYGYNGYLSAVDSFKIQAAYRAFHFVSDNGRECALCRDYDTGDQIGCIRWGTERV